MRRTGQQSLDAHAGRLLVLLDAFRADRKAMVGLTKLAKLDFLLRYPVFLERLLQADSIEWPERAEPTTHERYVVEEPMIRYKYGPWDNDYYPIIGSLVSRGLVTIGSRSSATVFQLTEAGSNAAKQLRVDPSWTSLSARADLLAEYFDTSGNKLKERIYQELPDAVDRPLREVIQ